MATPEYISVLHDLCGFSLETVDAITDQGIDSTEALRN
jgi:hypothetical protein